MKRNEIAQLLPAVFQQTLREGNPLTALLEAMEVLQAPSEAVLQRLDTFFDPRRTPDEFVPYLAHWADLTRLFEDTPTLKEGRIRQSSLASGLGRLRELIAHASYLSQWRGTRKGLLLFLQTATGATDFDIRENMNLEGEPKPFHISVWAPRETLQYKRLIERIVELEKPAYVTYELSFEPGSMKE